MHRTLISLICTGGLLLGPAGADRPTDGSVLPFPEPPMAGLAGTRLQDSTMKWPKKARRLAKDAPNILIVLLDDVGFGISETFGGEVRTPAFDKLAREGIRYNTFHTTSTDPLKCPENWAGQRIATCSLYSVAALGGKTIGRGRP